MHCIGKDELLTAFLDTARKASRLAGVGGVLSLAYASKRVRCGGTFDCRAEWNVE